MEMLSLLALTLAFSPTAFAQEAKPLLVVEAEALTEVVDAEAETRFAEGASGGAYLYLPNGTKTPGEGLASRARMRLSIERTRRLDLEVVALGAGSGSDSFFVIVDAGTPKTVSPPGDSAWTARQLSVFLTEGTHTITIAAREPARIDKMTLFEHQPKRTLHQLPLEAPEPAGRRPVAINPPTFRWPTFGAPPYTVEIGRKEDLADARPFPPVAETFLRPFEPLEPGRYYWRVKDATGKLALEPASFEMGGEVARWPIPSWQEATARVPAGRPRLLMRPEELPRLRALAAGECKDMVAKWERWAKGVVGARLAEGPKDAGDLKGREGKTMRRVYAKNFANKLASPIETLCVLYLLTQKEEYAAEVRRRALVAAELDPRGPVSHAVSDFANGTLTLNLAWAYDTLYDQWSDAERAQIRESILGRCRTGFGGHKPNREQSLFSAHGWQHVIQDLTLGALALYHESAEAKDWFDWSFKMHVALYPWFGGADGGSAEGTGYYEGTNMLQSLKAAAIFEAATGVSLFGNPWYRNTPYFLLYTHGPGTGKSQFADGSGLRPVGARGKLATTLWAAKLKDPYVAAFRDALGGSTAGGVVDCLRLLWQPLEAPAPKPLTGLPKARAFYDVGVVAMRSALANPTEDIFFELRSSPYGSYNHAHADQNSFNLVAFGERLIADSGYYQSYGDAHHYGWTVTSKAHNTILIGGSGQASRNVDAYGEIVDFEVGDGFVRTVGSCPHAYDDVAVERFDRHVLWLEPDVYLIADDLKTAEPQTSQWLLHSAEEMHVNGDTVNLHVGNASGRLWFVHPTGLRFEQTDRFDPPVRAWRPDRKSREYPDQWHLTASTIEPATAQRFVCVLQVWRTGAEGAIPAVSATQDETGVTISVADGRHGGIEWRHSGDR